MVEYHFVALPPQTPGHEDDGSPQPQFTALLASRGKRRPPVDEGGV